ncbi:MAG: hypothetical protein RMM58_01825 [Chloroflexota bacterium]|nr:hypothetical protein [Dehalococcoidia bacterium]MDW8252597.1 hypothetical protein [Chloroflexota bacterium]
MVCAVLTGMAKLLFAFDLGEREDFCAFPGHGWTAGEERSDGRAGSP